MCLKRSGGEPGNHYECLHKAGGAAAFGVCAAQLVPELGHGIKNKPYAPIGCYHQPIS